MTWTQEEGYTRGTLMPYGSPPHEGVQVQVTEIQAGDRIKPHRHMKQTEYIYFLEGKCTVYFEDHAIDLGPGDLIIFFPGDVHSAYNSNGSTARFLTLKLNGEPGDTDWNVTNSD